MPSWTVIGVIINCSVVTLVSIDSYPLIDWSSHLTLFQAQKYQALVDELHQNHLQLSLVELYHNEKGISVLSDTLRERQQAAAAKNSILMNGEKAVKTLKKEHGRLTREQQHIEKEIRYVCVDLDVKSRYTVSHSIKTVSKN